MLAFWPVLLYKFFMRFKFSPDELLSLSFLAILIAIVCFSPSNPATVRLLLIYFALGGAILGLTLLPRPERTGQAGFRHTYRVYYSSDLDYL